MFTASLFRSFRPLVRSAAEGRWTSFHKRQGYIITGNVNSFRQLHWYDKVTTPDGSEYEGEFKDGKNHGKGKFTSPDGSVLEGHFEDGVLHGYGKITEANRVYEGECKNGLPCGQGKLTHKFGVHEGVFKNGGMSGQGKFTGVDGNTCEGEFMDGKLHGTGKAIQFGDVSEGKFYKGLLNGSGKVTTDDGIVYEGKFFESYVHGRVKVYHPDGTVFAGEYKNGKFEGPVKITFPSGCTFEGDLYGKGSVKLKNGKVQKGGFLHRVFYPEGTPPEQYGENLLGIELSHSHIACIERMAGLLGVSPLRVKETNDRATLIGTVLDDVIKGWCKSTGHDGTVMRGTVQGGEFHGTTSFSFPNGDRLEGFMKHDKQCGHWVRTAPTGEVVHAFSMDDEAISDISVEDARRMEFMSEESLKALFDEAEVDE